MLSSHRFSKSFTSLKKFYELAHVPFVFYTQRHLSRDSMTSVSPLSLLRRYSDIPWTKYPAVKRDKTPFLNRKIKHPFAGPIGRLRETIQAKGHQKWGFVIYRCDYSDDEAWDKLLSNIRHEAAACLETLKAEDLLPSLEFTVKEDPKILNGATADQVHELFNSWVKSDEAKAENNNTPYTNLWLYPRYTFCVHADADSIDSVVRRAPQPPEYDFDEIGYVTLVQLIHDHFVEARKVEAAKTARLGLEAEEKDYEEEDDEDWSNINYVKVPIGYLGVESYGRMHDSETWATLVQYRRSDEVSCGYSSIGKICR